MAFALRRPLGATGFSVSPLALASSYGAGRAEVRRAFDSGINMFLWGALRRGDFGRGLSDIARTHRDELVIGVQSYVSHPWLLRPSVEIALRRLRIERLDVFCLAYWDRMPDRSTMDAAFALVRDDKIRTLMISSHERRLFPAFASARSFGALMLRYNAAHPAAETEVFPLLPETRPALVPRPSDFDQLRLQRRNPV